MIRTTRLSCLLAGTLVTLGVGASVAQATTFDVNSSADNKSDDGMCTLREAVDAANTNMAQQTNDCPAGESANTDLIELDADGYRLAGNTEEDANATSDLDIMLGGGDLQITGQGNPDTTIDIDTTVTFDRLLDVVGTGTLTVTNLRLDEGQVNGPSSGGANIFTGVNSELVLSNVRVSNGNAFDSSGGGILAFGPLTLLSVEIDGNSAKSNGGPAAAAAILAFSSLSIDNSSIHSNTSTTAPAGNQDGTVIRGGAISVAQNGSLLMSDSSVQNNPLTATNTTRTPLGAGIFLSDADATITGSTISGNTTGAGTNPAGAGLFFNDTANAGPADDTLIIQNSTISNNVVGAATTGTETGGGLEARGGVTSLYNVTFNSNGADDGGFALSWTPVVGQTGGSVTTHGSIFHEDGTRECLTSGGGMITTAGYNVERGNTCDLDPMGTDLIAQNVAQIALDLTLQNNGGPTQTHSIGAASVAKDLIPAAECTDAGGVNPLLADQRGVERPFNGNCDAGAYELATCNTQTVDGTWTVGTVGNDIVNGTAAVDKIVTGAGNDTVTPAGAADVVCTGGGADTVQLVDATADTADCGAGTDFFNADGADALTACETNLNPPPVVLTPTTPTTSTPAAAPATPKKKCKKKKRKRSAAAAKKCKKKKR